MEGREGGKAYLKNGAGLVVIFIASPGRLTGGEGGRETVWKSEEGTGRRYRHGFNIGWILRPRDL